MISDPGTPTLDQLRVFLTVVELGSFAAAARKLHRATSVISYSMANLELQLGVTLFDRQTTRKPQLTEAGRPYWQRRAPSPTACMAYAPRSKACCRGWRLRCTWCWK